MFKTLEVCSNEFDQFPEDATPFPETKTTRRAEYVAPAAKISATLALLKAVTVDTNDAADAIITVKRTSIDVTTSRMTMGVRSSIIVITATTARATVLIRSKGVITRFPILC